MSGQMKKEIYTWEDIMEAYSQLMTGDTPEEGWEHVYREAFPENENARCNRKRNLEEY